MRHRQSRGHRKATIPVGMFTFDVKFLQPGSQGITCSDFPDLEAVYHAYPSGMREFAVYHPEIIPGAGRVLVVVGTKLPENKKYWLHTNEVSRYASERTKADALVSAFFLANTVYMRKVVAIEEAKGTLAEAGIPIGRM